MLFFPTTNPLAPASPQPSAEPDPNATTRELSRAEWLAFLYIDQHQCWHRGERILVEDYLQRHPRLQADEDGVLDLIFSELMLRESQGEAPHLEEYLDRFQCLETQLRQQFTLHFEPDDPESRASHAPTCRLTEDRLPTKLSDRGGCDTDLSPWDFERKEALDALPSRGKSWLGRGGDCPEVPGYDLLGELGRGGMGVVYKARQRQLKRLVALKIIQANPQATDELTRFYLEAESVARLQHPNIVQIYEIGTWQTGGEGPPRPFLALELITGGSLEEHIAGKPQPPRPSAQLLEELARAMHYAHQQGIIHRDLKPANVLLQIADCRLQIEKQELSSQSAICNLQSAIPKITDFGLAKRLDEGTTVTRNGAVLGTPSYMAPEQAAGKPRRVGPACDIYSLGAILYELLTGRPPFQGETAWDTLLHVAARDPVAPRQLQPRVPTDLETICLKCLEKDPAHRYASAVALADDLRRFLDGRPVLARPTPSWERAAKWARRRPAAAALILMTALTGSLLIAGGLLYGRAKHQEALFLEQELTQRRRWDERRAAAQDWIQESQQAAAARDWQSARLHLCRALAHVASEPSLADVQEQAEHLLTEANARFEEQARRELARQRFDQFLRLRNEALFHASRFLGWEQAAGGDLVQQPARQALELYGLTSATSAPQLDLAFLESREHTALREGCYELLLVAAEVEAAQGERAHIEQALRLLDRAEQLGISTRTGSLRRSRYLALLGDEESAARERQRAEMRKPVHAIDFFLAGQEAVQTGDARRAIADLEQALRREPNHFWAEYFLAVGYLQTGRLVEAKTCLTACLSRQSGFVWLYVLRGYAHAELNEFAAAEEDFRAALEQQADDLARYGVLVNRGAARFRQGRLAEAEADLQEALRLKPEEYSAYLNLARVYEAGRKTGLARQQFDRAIEKQPALPLLYRARARWLYLQRQDTEALQDLNTAIHLEKDQTRPSASLAESYLDRGRILHRLGKFDEAVQAYEAALAVQIEPSKADRFLAEALLELRRYDDALQTLDRYLKQGNAEGAVYRTRGLIRSKLGRHAEALEDYTRALELQPEAATLVCRGWAYLLVHDSPRLARRDFDEAIRLDPHNGDAYNGRGYSRVRLGQVQLGLADAEEALRQGQSNPRLLYNAARIYAQVSSQAAADARISYQQRALQLLKQALEAQPTDKRTTFWRDCVQADLAWTPLRRSPAYAQLAAAYGQR